MIQKNMYKGRRILGIITARGGSKGIPRKNIKELCGKPLAAYTIEAAKRSELLTRCIFSTEDQEIAQIASEFGADIPFMRPQELAQDDSTSMEVVQHVLTWLKNNAGEEYDYTMILQPTSPLRNSDDIDAAIRKVVDTGADSVMAMMELVDLSLRKLKKIEDDRILPLVEIERKQSSRRQDAEKIYKRNGSIFLTKTSLILRGDLFGGVSRPYLMPQERSVDINEPADFDLAEFWMKKLNLA
jgi:CMP-N-acetylneuraminic acid synthetase